VISCPRCAAGDTFDGTKARRDLLRFRRRGPATATARLVQAIEASGKSERLGGNPFRVYLHPPGAMARVLEERGLRWRWGAATWGWSVELYERAA